MPVYEYQCAACSHQFEEWQKITEAAIKKCPKCGKDEVERLISQTAFMLKGGGWYKDLYSSSKSDTKAESSASGSAKTDGAKSESKSDGAKSESKSDAGAGSSASSASSGSTAAGSSSGGSSSSSSSSPSSSSGSGTTK
jgi:putative FmdB family regulatory protein